MMLSKFATSIKTILDVHSEFHKDKGFLGSYNISKNTNMLLWMARYCILRNLAQSTPFHISTQFCFVWENQQLSNDSKSSAQFSVWKIVSQLLTLDIQLKGNPSYYLNFITHFLQKVLLFIFKYIICHHFLRFHPLLNIFFSNFLMPDFSTKSHLVFLGIVVSVNLLYNFKNLK